ncbi:glutaredoxin [Nannochloropsis oceanica]
MRTSSTTFFCVVATAALMSFACLLPKTAAFVLPTAAWASRIGATAPSAIVSTYTRRMGTLAMAAPEAIISDAIKKPVMVFSKSTCPFCKKAKATLIAEGAKFEVIELDQRDDGPAIQAALAATTGRRTVPNVFVGGKSIGGGDDTKALSDSGKLKAMLQSAGAL